MKKRHLYILVSVLSFLISCGNEHSDYRLSVPNDALVVVQLQLDDLMEAADIPTSLLDDWTDMLPNGLGNSVQDIIDDPTLLGIDWQSPVYVFITPDKLCGLVARVEDEGHVDAVMDELHSERLCSSVKEDGGVKSCKIGSEAQLAYDGEGLLIIVPLEGRMRSSVLASYATERMDRKSSNSYFGKDTPLDDCNKPLAAVVNGELIEQINDINDEWSEAVRLMRSSLREFGAKLGDVTYLFTFDSQAHDMVITLSQRTDNEALLSYMDDLLDEWPKLGGSLAAYVDEDDAVTCLFTCNGEAVLENLKKNSDARRTLQQMEDYLDVEALLKSLHGEIAFSLDSDDNFDDWDNARFVFAAQVSDKDLAESIPEWLSNIHASDEGFYYEVTGSGQWILGSREYEWTEDWEMVYGEGYNVVAYLGIQDGVLNISNKPLAQFLSRSRGLETDVMGLRLYFHANLSGLDTPIPVDGVTLTSEDLQNYTFTIHGVSLADLVDITRYL